MKVIIQNYQLLPVLASIYNVRKYTDKIDVATNLKMDEISDVLLKPMERIENRRPELMENHIVKNPNGTFKTKKTLGEEEYVFKSEEDEEKYLSVMEKENVFDLDLLSKDEIMKLTTGKDKNGNSGTHLHNIKLITEGYANIKDNKSNKNKNDKEE